MRRIPYSIRERRPRVAMILFLHLMPALALSGQVIYVDAHATGRNDGSSWGNAFTFLQDALADVNDSPRRVEIWVAQGTYKPDRGAGKKPQDPEATFQLVNGVALTGGYAGLGETDPNMRDVDQYETILSGDLTDDDPEVNDPRDLLSGKGWNSHAVVTGSGTDSTAVLDGFTVTGGRYPPITVRIIPGYSGPPMGSGGAMNNLRGSPTVIGCTFIGNASHGAGGGMYNGEGSHPRVIDCAFIRNYASGRGGGAVANSGDSDATFVRCIFTENSTWDRGGAVYNHRSRPTLDGCTFNHNRTVSEYDGNGGGLFSSNSSPVLSKCLFSENAASSGGAISGDDGSRLVADRCIFVRNKGERAGAIYDRTRDVRSIFTNCVFSGNTGRGYGGAVRVSNTAFTNCVFAGNRARGYALYGGAWQPSAGGAVCDSGLNAFTNCTFDNNWAESGCALYTSYPVPSSIKDCIFRGSEDQIRDEADAGLCVQYSNIQGGWLGESNINLDPAFANPGYWVDPDGPNRSAEPNDPNSVWMDGDYHLKSQAGRWDPVSRSWVKDDVTSPCIDAGDPNSPVGEEPFPNGGRVNMGAYGGTSQASKSYFGGPACETIIAGDINGDCKVDSLDMAILARHWLEDGTGR